MPHGEFIQGPGGRFAGSRSGGKAEHEAAGRGQLEKPGRHPLKGYSKEASLDKNGVIHTGNVDDAVLALSQNREIELKQPREVSTLLDRLGKISADMIAKGEKAPDFDLCNVSVAGTNLFCAESKGIPRIKMPQLTSQQTTEFLKDLERRGFKVSRGTEYAAHLRATQDQLNGSKVAAVANYIQQNPEAGDRPIIVNRDNYILDGHHTWAAKVGLDAADNILADDKKMNCIRVDCGIIQLLHEANKFTGGKGRKGVGDRWLRAVEILAALTGDRDMPWKSSESKSHTKKADTPRKRKAWAKIANAALKQYKGNEGKAVRVANAAVARMGNGDIDTVLRDAMKQIGAVKLFDKRYKKTTEHDPFGRVRRVTEEHEAGPEDFGPPDDRKVEAKEAKNLAKEKKEKKDAATADRSRRSTIVRDPRGRLLETREEEEFGEYDSASIDQRSRDPNDKPDIKQPDEDDDDDSDWPDEGDMEQIAEEMSDCSDYRYPYRSAIYDREFTGEQRKEAAEEGHAMKGGGFPIKNKEDLGNARQALGRAKNRGATIRHIKKRAKALGVDLPEGWPNDSMPMPEVRISDAPTFADAAGITLYDTIELDADAKVRYTDDGYLVAAPRIARTGIQLYRGQECGRQDADIIRVFRPADEVFKHDAMRSLAHRPVTLEHPPEVLNADNWKKYAVGQTGDEVIRDGGTIRVPMVLMDAAAIEAYENGTDKLSVGYDCDLQWGEGVTGDGETYDAIQRNIRANHLAVVAAARGGPTLRIGDDQSVADKGDHTMQLKTITVDGMDFQVGDTAAPFITRHINELQQRLADAFKRAKEAEEEAEENEEENGKKDAALKARDAALRDKDKLLEQKDGEISGLKQQLKDAEVTPAKLNAMVIEKMSVINKAKGILGDKYTIGDKTNEEVRRDVVVAKVGDHTKGWSDDRIFGAFESMATERVVDAVPSRGGIDDMMRAFNDNTSGRPGVGYGRVDPRDAAYADYDRTLNDAWRGPQHGGNAQ